MTEKESFMKLFKHLLFFTALFLLSFNPLFADEKIEEMLSNISVSPQTQTCLGCHIKHTPGIARDWLSSRHAKTRPAEAMKKPALEKRMSAESPPKELQEHVVGCYECHGLNGNSHKDNFEHMGRRINVVVTPRDCETCHPDEVGQFTGSKKSYAYKNLMENPVYFALTGTITGIKKVDNNILTIHKPTEATLHETCLGCHGTHVEANGLKTVATKLGSIEVPNLTNWPNQGVGRINPDGSRGACTACHPRHGFLIEVARKPYTCSQCHLEPDVPAWNIYKESKHGNIYSSKGNTWDFGSVPWKVGEDFKAPTCSTCHNSLIVSPDNEVIAERSHNFGARLWVRLFGLIYSHPQPISGDTTVIKNKDGLPLPVTFSGDVASDYLVDRPEQEKRLNAMSSICSGCHSSTWIKGHFSKLESTIRETDDMTLAATKLLSAAWGKGIEDKANPFDESIEQMWIRQWLFYSNSIRYSSAMTGAPDYASFKNGWWYLTENLLHMKDWIEFKGGMKDKD